MALILFENLFRTGSVNTIGTVSGNVDGLIDGRTSTSESFATGATREFRVDMTTATNVNCLGVGRNNLSTHGATVTVQGSTDDAIYSTLFSITPTADDVLIKLDSTTHSYRYYRIQISGHSSNVFACDIAIGEAKTLERDQKSGFIAPLYADGDEVIPNVTRGQNLVGLSIKQGLKRVRVGLPYYTSAFFSDWQSFIAVLKTYPVYLVWKSDNTSEAFYCWPWRRLPQPKYSASISGYAYFDTILDLEGITS